MSMRRKKRSDRTEMDVLRTGRQEPGSGSLSESGSIVVHNSGGTSITMSRPSLHDQPKLCVIELLEKTTGATYIDGRL